MQLMSNFQLNFKNIEEQFNISFEDYFRDSLKELEIFEQEDLITLSKEGIKVSQTGTLLIRNIAMAFDSYLKKINPTQNVFSKTI